MSSQNNTLKRLIMGASITMAIAFGANAQHSNGNIAGTAVAGDTVVIQGSDTGWHRELTIKKDGKFQVRAVPSGEYVVTITHADGKAEPAKPIIVRVGSTARVQ
ncbi:carboxypeptidase-like regulatory domain-containing protein [Lysobacter sp. CFH 32150]|uniref:carboxypeptidase-like regulatory domain-containing protein n=1 Tax=Lysobacter sp. CFH 32150 TaxID=2927128 RepID=UPI001FA6B3AC|nr:carboxypeptidase-like regulatory domain-containing protein [Lysobacter sp. CFH 32150]MCI4568422.1 carboxypeptidase-like regulatory domain-containing protein [Lysobacter sp. CFH 32150]